MKKNLWVLLIVSLVLLLGMTDCGNWAEAKTAGGVVIYSPCSEDIINTIIPMFEKETGIKVDLITAGTGELVKRLESERHNPYADIMFGVLRLRLCPMLTFSRNTSLRMMSS